MATKDDERFLSSGDEVGTAPGDRTFRPDVEGLRALAIILVLLSHFWIPGFFGGGVGVDVFFVISGFVITGVLMRERAATGHTSFLNFYARRGRRIIPVAMLVVVVTLVIYRVSSGRAATQALADPTRWVVLFAFNFDHSAIDAEIFRPQPFGPYWSLAVEEQFYLVYPTLVLALLAIGRSWSWRLKVFVFLIAVIAASLAWSIITSGPGGLIAYVSSFTRAWELAIGCLIAWNASLFRRMPLWLAAAISWLGIALILGEVFIAPPTASYPGSLALFPVSGAALVIIGGTTVSKWGVERVLGLRPVRAIGRWSFGLYLWEIPVFTLAVHWWGPINLMPLGGRVALILVTAVIAAASFAFIEKPIRHSRRLINSPTLSLGCAVAFIVGALATIRLVTF
jgi:peptidoglycan/LPS O-acetylase OafA/YrhL